MATSTFTYDGTDFNMYSAVNAANPTFSIGSSATNDLSIQTIYDGGTQVLNFVNIQATSSSGVANKGKIRISIDGNATYEFLDTGFDLIGSSPAVTFSTNGGSIESDTGGLTYTVLTGDSHEFVNGTSIALSTTEA